MNTPIEFDDIQVRDTVTRDLEGIASTMTVERRDQERVYPNDLTCLMDHPGSVWRLVNRPKPDVVIPVAALDELRESWVAVTSAGAVFLAAVDVANEATS